MKFNDMLKKKKTDAPETTEAINDTIDNESESALADVPAEKSGEDLLKEELSLANDKYLRLYAEFDNFRRRTIKEREDARKMEGKDLITSLLPVLDDFERALKATENATDVAPVREGVMLIQNKLKNTLTQKGLQPMESIGQPFDADLHEAITNIPAPADDLKGKVIDEMEKGYYLNDKVIRFAKVIVGA
ncbi:nucleotide exchange factor GrpE [Mucilaginibacter sp.]|uniref:nucleotide exchange factor GrpE n=1 Tax=Mucilaginibacter sp. TaxID=1882438 RepID=UPI0026117EAB|nr:nucleotide exchange factor GrpE [Mucilaginibacter sp.]